MNVAFDVGNVLVHVDFDEFFKKFKELASSTEDPQIFLNDIQARQDIGLKTLDVALKARFDLSSYKIDSLVDAWNKSIVINDDMSNFVNDLIKNDGVQVAIVSNMGHEHARYIKKTHPSLFSNKTLHLSCEVGARKPTKLYYQSFLMENPQFEGCLFVDDRPENLDAAQSFGFRGYCFSLERYERMHEARKALALKRMRSEIIKWQGWD